jgi:RHS repeat-associated protein
VTITHNGNGTASVYTNGAGSTTFTVRNDGAPLTALFSASICTGNITNCSASPTGAYLSTGASTTVTVSFTGGTAAGSGQLRLTARDASDNSVMNYYDIAVTVSTDPNAPTLDLSPHLGDRRDVSQCIADCFESTLSYTTPAYVSLDVPRSVTLLYRSGNAYPHGTLTLDASSSTAPAGSTFRLQLVDQNGAYVTFTNGTTALYFARNTTGPTRIVGQFKADTIPTSARLYTARVSTIKSDGSVFATAVASVRILVLNDVTNPLGAGVNVVGLQRIFSNQPGGVLVTDGTGSASFFSGSCSPSVACNFTSPSGDFSKLTTTGSGYRRAYPDSMVVTFNATGLETSLADRFGTTTQVSWVLSPELSVYVPTAFTDPTGQTITLNYRDAANAGTSYRVGSMGQILIQGGTRWANFGVLPSGNLEHFVDADNVCCDVASYDSQHRLTQFATKPTLVSGIARNYTYRYGATVDYIDAPAIDTGNGGTARPRITLRNAGDALLSAAAAGNGTSATPLAVLANRRAFVIGPVGDSTYFSLTRFGSPDTVKALLTPAASAKYDSLTGQLLRSVSPNGDVTRFTWSVDKLTQTYDSTAGKTVNIEYKASYSLPKRIYGDVVEQLFTYDTTKTGWPLATSRVGSSSAAPSYFQFDTYGRPTSASDPGVHTTSYAYQSSGLRNRISVTAPNGQTTSSMQDAFGRDTSVTDAAGRTSKTQYDALNRPTLTANGARDTTKFQYDVLSNVSVLTDPKGQVYSMQRNALGWVIRRTDPGSRIDSTFYDIAGRVVRVRTRGNRQVRLVYDSLSRITKRLGLTSGDSVKYAYDPQHRWVIDSVFSGSALTSVDSIVTDSVGRTIREFTIRPGVGSWRVSSVFNTTNPGRSSAVLVKTSVTPPTVEAQVDYTFDANKRDSTINVAFGKSTFGYNAEDFPSTVTFQGGVVETTTQTSNHAESVRSYSLSAVDTVLKRWYKTDSLSRVVERGAAGALFQTFSYDSAGRLRTWVKKQRTNTPSCIDDNTYGYVCNGTIANTLSSMSMSYDRAGNPTDLGAVVAAGNRLTTFNGFTMTYDNDGNMLTRVGPGGVNDTYTWDDFGQLKSVTRSGVAQPTTFAYDGFGRRIRKTSGGVTIHYIWDSDQIFAEVNGSGATLQTYSYNPGIDQPRSVTAGGEVYFMSTGLGGDVNGLIKQSNNTVAAQYTYTPWGELESDQQFVGSLRVNSLRWHGLAYDSETGLYQVRARYYDPATRRFISEDPIGLEGGINSYVFAQSDPVNAGDPSGLDECYMWYAQSTNNGQVLTVWREPVPCPLEGNSITDSPWGEPMSGRLTISPAAIEQTLRKVKTAEGRENLTGGEATAGFTSWVLVRPIPGEPKVCPRYISIRTRLAYGFLETWKAESTSTHVNNNLGGIVAAYKGTYKSRMSGYAEFKGVQGDVSCSSGYGYLLINVP